MATWTWGPARSGPHVPSCPWLPDPVFPGHRWRYPDVYQQIEPVGPFDLPGYRTEPGDMLVALEYITEFVAHAADYPLSESTP